MDPYYYQSDSSSNQDQKKNTKNYCQTATY